MEIFETPVSIILTVYIPIPCTSCLIWQKHKLVFFPFPGLKVSFISFHYSVNCFFMWHCWHNIFHKLWWLYFHGVSWQKYFKWTLFAQLDTLFLHTETSCTPAAWLIFPKMTPQWTCGQACLGNLLPCFPTFSDTVNLALLNHSSSHPVP
jgi:hypothetical protein